MHGVSLHLPGAIGAGLLGRPLGQVFAREHAQHLGDGERAGRGWRHAADAVRSIGKTHRLALAGLVVGQIAHAQTAWIRRVRLHCLGDGLCHWALVEHLGAALCDALQRVGKFCVAQQGAFGFGVTVGVEKVRPSRSVLGERRDNRLAKNRCQARADGKALSRQSYCGLKEARPRQTAMLAMRQFQGAQDPGHAHRAAAHHAVTKRHGLAVAQKELRGRSRRSGFTAIKSPHALAVKGHHDQTAADATGVRFDQGQDHLCSDGRIDRTAASAQNLARRLARQRVTRRHQMA